jgi:hypothetical protein
VGNEITAAAPFPKIEFEAEIELIEPLFLSTFRGGAFGVLFA